MKTLRWNRIFGRDGRALIVAIDHITAGFMAGWEHPSDTLEKVLQGNPDAVMTNYGILKQFASLFSGQVGTILRVDSGPTYLLEEWPDYTRWESLFSVEEALRLGVDGVLATIFIGGPIEVDSRTLAARMAASCLDFGMPCGFESLPAGPKIKDPFDSELVAFASRLAAEFGADFVKTYYTGDSTSFRRVTERCPVPVLMAGGPKVDDERSFFDQVAGMLDAGGHGVFVGRNVWQHRDPGGFVRALGRIIHQGTSVDDALRGLAHDHDAG